MDDLFKLKHLCICMYIRSFQKREPYALNRNILLQPQKDTQTVSFKKL